MFDEKNESLIERFQFGVNENKELKYELISEGWYCYFNSREDEISSLWFTLTIQIMNDEKIDK